MTDFSKPEMAAMEITLLSSLNLVMPSNSLLESGMRRSKRTNHDEGFSSIIFRPSKIDLAEKIWISDDEKFLCQKLMESISVNWMVINN